MADSRRRPPPPARPAAPTLGRGAAAPREAPRAPVREPPRRHVVDPGEALVAPPPGVRVVTRSGFVDTASGAYEPAPPPPPTLSRREFESELQRLLRAFQTDQDNPGSMRCEGCRRCV